MAVTWKKLAFAVEVVPTTRTVATTAPLTGGGTLAGDLTLAISNFTSGSAGAVPAPGSAAGKFLRDDATWAAPTVSSGVGLHNELKANTVIWSGYTVSVSTYVSVNEGVTLSIEADGVLNIV